MYTVSISTHFASCMPLYALVSIPGRIEDLSSIEACEFNSTFDDLYSPFAIKSGAYMCA